MFQKLLFSVAITICLSFTSVGAIAQQLEAPMWRGALGHYVIEVSINGQGPFNLVVDTAASLSASSACA